MLIAGAAACCVGGLLYWKTKQLKQLKRKKDISQLRNLSEAWRWKQAHKAIKTSNNEHLELLLEAGVGINRASAMEGSLLMIATKHGNHKAAELLLNAGANIDQQGPASLDKQRFTDMTALMGACLLADDKLVGLLLSKGADPNLCNEDKRVALMFALNPGMLYKRKNERRAIIIKLLLEAEANPAVRDPQCQNDTILQTAVSVAIKVAGNHSSALFFEKPPNKFTIFSNVIRDIVDARKGILFDDEQQSFTQAHLGLLGNIGKKTIAISESVWKEKVWPTCLESMQQHTIPKDISNLILQLMLEPKEGQ